MHMDGKQCAALLCIVFPPLMLALKRGKGGKPASFPWILIAGVAMSRGKIFPIPILACREPENLNSRWKRIESGTKNYGGEKIARLIIGKKHLGFIA